MSDEIVLSVSVDHRVFEIIEQHADGMHDDGVGRQEIKIGNDMFLKIRPE